MLRVNGEPLREVAALEAVLPQAKAGDTLRLQCSRRKAARKLLDRQPWETVDIELVLPAAAPAKLPADQPAERPAEKPRGEPRRSY